MVSEHDASAMENSSPATIGASSSSISRYGPVVFTHSLSVKLTNDNFLLWSHQVLAAIKDHRLMHFVKNSTKPVEFLSASDKALGKINPEFVDWEQQDQLLLSWLLSSMYENLLTRMIGCDESSKIWSKLEQYFAVTTKARIKQLWSQLSSTTKANLSMNDYLLKIKNIVDLLGSIGEEISASAHIDAIFEGLNSEYDSFFTSVEP